MYSRTSLLGSPHAPFFSLLWRRNRERYLAFLSDITVCTHPYFRALGLDLLELSTLLHSRSSSTSIFLFPRLCYISTQAWRTKIPSIHFPITASQSSRIGIGHGRSLSVSASPRGLCSQQTQGHAELNLPSLLPFLTLSHNILPCHGVALYPYQVENLCGVPVKLKTLVSIGVTSLNDIGLPLCMLSQALSPATALPRGLHIPIQSVCSLYIVL